MQPYAVSAFFVLSLALGCASSHQLGDILTPHQARALAEEALRHTPEHTHFARGTEFQWVLLVRGKQGDYPEAFRALRDALSSRYIVYTDGRDLPEGSTWHDGVATAYRNGFIFSVDIRQVDAHTIGVTYSDYEGSLAGGRQVVRYQWAGDRWREASRGPQIVS